jgi:hypothetical protein
LNKPSRKSRKSSKVIEPALKPPATGVMHLAIIRIPFKIITWIMASKFGLVVSILITIHLWTFILADSSSTTAAIVIFGTAIILWAVAGIGLSTLQKRIYG